MGPNNNKRGGGKLDVTEMDIYDGPVKPYNLYLEMNRNG